MVQNTTVFVGLDVHKDSIAVACIGSQVDEAIVDVGTIGTQQYAIDRLLKKLAGRGHLKLVYEAGPCGFWLQRYLAGKGQDCLVAAPSLIPKRPGERVKTDRRDARNLALALRAGTLTAVHIPTPEQEAFRDVVRAWQQSKRDITSAKQRLKPFLLRHDIRYVGRASWNSAHRRWFSELVLPNTAQQSVFQELLDAINERERRRDRLERELDVLAPTSPGYALAQALLAFRGIQKTVAYTGTPTRRTPDPNDHQKGDEPTRIIIAACLLLLASSPSAEEQTRVYQTDAYGNVQRHRPSYSVGDDGRVVQVDPYGNRQRNKQQYVVRDGKASPTDAYGRVQRNRPPLVVDEDGRVVRTDPYGSRLGQVLVVEGDRVYATDRYGNKRGQAYVVKEKNPTGPKR